MPFRWCKIHRSSENYYYLRQPICQLKRWNFKRAIDVGNHLTNNWIGKYGKNASAKGSSFVRRRHRRVPAIDNESKFDFNFHRLSLQIACAHVHIGARQVYGVRCTRPLHQTNEKCKANCFPFIAVAIANSTPALRSRRKLQNNAFFMSTFRFNHMVHGRFLACCCCCSCVYHYSHRARAIRTIIVCQSHRDCCLEHFCLNSNSKKQTFYHFHAILFRFDFIEFQMNERIKRTTIRYWELDIALQVNSSLCIPTSLPTTLILERMKNSWKKSVFVDVARRGKHGKFAEMVSRSTQGVEGTLLISNAIRRFNVLAERYVHGRFNCDWLVRHVQL